MNDQKDPEIKAITDVQSSLEGLDHAVIARVLRWAADRYQIETQASNSSRPENEDNKSKTSKQDYADVASLFAAAAPKSQSDKALVIGYWFQVIEGSSDFAAQQVNAALKNLGHKIPNITNAFTSLMKKKPQLILQVKKAGVTQQARKRYKLTTAGISWVQHALLNGGLDEE